MPKKRLTRPRLDMAERVRLGEAGSLDQVRVMARALNLCGLTLEVERSETAGYVALYAAYRLPTYTREG